MALDDGACDPLLFQKGGIFPTTNKTLKGHSYHLTFHNIKRSSGVHADCDPLLFQKGGIFPTTNKTLKGHSYHLIFHIKRSSGVHADRNIKDSYWRLCYY